MRVYSRESVVAIALFCSVGSCSILLDLLLNASANTSSKHFFALTTTTEKQEHFLGAVCKTIYCFPHIQHAAPDIFVKKQRHCTVCRQEEIVILACA